MTRPDPAARPPAVDLHAVLATHWAANVTPPEDGEKGVPPDVRCIACHEPWRGTPGAGGCTAALLAQRVIEAERQGDEMLANAESFERSAQTFLHQRAEARARALLLEGLLRRLEWADGLDGVGGYCFLCGQFASRGHAPACDFVVALESPAAARVQEGE